MMIARKKKLPTFDQIEATAAVLVKFTKYVVGILILGVLLRWTGWSGVMQVGTLLVWSSVIAVAVVAALFFGLVAVQRQRLMEFCLSYRNGDKYLGY